MAGTWQELPSNCTRDIGLTYQRCLSFGTIGVRAMPPLGAQRPQQMSAMG